MTISEANSPVAEKLPVFIKERGLKNNFVAEKAGLSPLQLTEIVTGRRLMKICEIPKFATVLGVTPNDLFGVGDK